jgi:hypothetical protein
MEIARLSISVGDMKRGDDWSVGCAVALVSIGMGTLRCTMDERSIGVLDGKEAEEMVGTSLSRS